MHCSAKKAELLVKALRQTLSDFSRDRLLRRLSFNEEQIHKFERQVAIERVSVISLVLVSDVFEENSFKTKAKARGV